LVGSFVGDDIVMRLSNEFKLSTEYNGVTNTETVIVKTSLIFVKEQGWKVDDVEFIGQLTGRE
jgi:hypothetical protein